MNIGDKVTWADGSQSGVISGWDGPYYVFVDDQYPSTNRTLRPYSSLRPVEPCEVRLKRALRRRMEIRQALSKRRTQS
jgi:hypothetical protein